MRTQEDNDNQIERETRLTKENEPKHNKAKAYVTYRVQSVRSKKKVTAFLLVILKYSLCFEQKSNH